MIMFSSRRKANRDRKRIADKIGSITEYLDANGILAALGGTISQSEKDLVQIKTTLNGMNTMFTVSFLPNGIVIHVLFCMQDPSKLVEQVRDCNILIHDIQVQDFIDLAVKAGEKHKDLFPEEWTTV